MIHLAADGNTELNAADLQLRDNNNHENNMTNIGKKSMDKDSGANPDSNELDGKAGRRLKAPSDFNSLSDNDDSGDFDVDDEDDDEDFENHGAGDDEDDEDDDGTSSSHTMEEQMDYLDSLEPCPCYAKCCIDSIITLFCVTLLG